MDFKQWAIDRPLGEPGTTGYMMAEAAWAAASAAERERCAKLCEDISDEYQRREGRRCREFRDDAQEGASKCADAIRGA